MATIMIMVIPTVAMIMATLMPMAAVTTLLAHATMLMTMRMGQGAMAAILHTLVTRNAPAIRSTKQARMVTMATFIAVMDITMIMTMRMHLTTHLSLPPMQWSASAWSGHHLMVCYMSLLNLLKRAATLTVWTYLAPHVLAVVAMVLPGTCTACHMTMPMGIHMDMSIVVGRMETTTIRTSEVLSCMSWEISCSQLASPLLVLSYGAHLCMCDSPASLSTHLLSSVVPDTASALDLVERSA